jgi:hypothetical protein
MISLTRRMDAAATPRKGFAAPLGVMRSSGLHLSFLRSGLQGC